MKFVVSDSRLLLQGIKNKNAKAMSEKLSKLTTSYFSSFVKRCSPICQQDLCLPDLCLS